MNNENNWWEFECVLIFDQEKNMQKQVKYVANEAEYSQLERNC